MPPRIVRRGEHLAAIAYRHGVDPKDVWDSSKNASIRAAREGGHMLAEGDLVDLPPERHPEPTPLRVGMTTTFTATIPKVPVEIVLTQGGEPIASEPWHVEGRGEAASGTTGSDGKVRFEVRVTTPAVDLVLERMKQRRHVSVGGLDPTATTLGASHRLRNLGYFGGAPTSRPTPELAAATRAFQLANDLPGTGQLDSETRAVLAQVHGS